MSINKQDVSSWQRVNLGINHKDYPMPNFIQAQLDSFAEFYKSGFQRLFSEINPVKDTMEKMWTLEFRGFRYGDPNRSVEEAFRTSSSYDAPLYADVMLLNNKTGEIKEQVLFIADVPLMTDRGFFIVNGVTRVVIHQIVRAEGVLFERSVALPTRDLYQARLMPSIGPWYTFEIGKNDVISVRLVQKRPKIVITELLRVFGYETDDEIRELFSSVDTDEEHKYIEASLARDFSRNKEEAIINIYNKLRPDESVSLESAERYIKGLFFNKSRVHLGRVGRHQLNRKLGLDYPVTDDAKLTVEDIVKTIEHLIQVQNGVVPQDDVDSLSNRRIRSVGEVLLGQLRIGVRRLEKNIRDKMSMYGEDAKLTPSMLVNAKPISAALLSFFGSNQLSSFMEQTNVLAELENKRKVTAAGPRGLTKERATFSVREVHFSQYSRFDPVTSPESQSIGVVNQLAMLARVNKFGFIEAPYFRVLQKVKNDKKALVGRIPLADIKAGEKTIVKAGQVIKESTAEVIAKKVKEDEFDVVSYVTDEVVYVDAIEEAEEKIAMATTHMDNYGNLQGASVLVRHGGTFSRATVQEVTMIDVTPAQQAGLGMALIPFVAHDESMRALTGSIMQKQAVPLVKNQAPLVGTGFEKIVAQNSGWALYAEDDGTIEYVDAKRITIKYKKLGKTDYSLVKFFRSTRDTAFSQYPRVEVGDKVKKGDLLADGPSMQNGELALGVNLRAALMFFDGYNYEDSALISERVVKEDLLTSVHISRYVVDVRDTKLGPETITADIPHVSERILKKLDENGLVRVGVSVEARDILVGIVAPRGEKELTAEERLLRAIFGDITSDVKDNSLRLPNGEKGIVIKRQVISIDENENLPPGTLKRVTVWIASTRKIDFGDKISGRHGDKNTIAAIRPVEDMPFTEDGEPVDIVLTPTFIKRMNMGQAMEVHYGAIAEALGVKLAFPLFEKVDEEWLEKELKKKGIEFSQKVDLYDGRTGEKFPRKISVGIKYVLKLHHIASEKMHARSTGPYTLITQQPLGGKAQMGGQRFGEMEVWALEAHGAANTLYEMLTIKSDDVKGRSQAYRAIIQGEKIEISNVPESFKVLIKELNALCLNIDLIYNESKEVDEKEQTEQQ